MTEKKIIEPGPEFDMKTGRGQLEKLRCHGLTTGNTILVELADKVTCRDDLWEVREKSLLDAALLAAFFQLETARPLALMCFMAREPNHYNSIDHLLDEEHSRWAIDGVEV